MTELKTIKDLKKRIYYLDEIKDVSERISIDEKDLRQEAIKWIKSLNNYDNENMEVKKWIRYFFNITEEELKEQEK